MTKWTLYTTIETIETIEATSLNDAIEESRKRMSKDQLGVALNVRNCYIKDISIKGYKSIDQDNDKGENQ